MREGLGKGLFSCFHSKHWIGRVKEEACSCLFPHQFDPDANLLGIDR